MIGDEEYGHFFVTIEDAEVEWCLAHRVLRVEIAVVPNQQNCDIHEIPLRSDMEGCLPKLIVLVDEEPIVGEQVPHVADLVTFDRTEELLGAFAIESIPRNDVLAIVACLDSVVVDICCDIYETL